MASPPRRPSKRKTDAPRAAVADRAVIAKPADPRQAGLFDEPLPKWIRPCLPTLVDKPPVGPQWVPKTIEICITANLFANSAFSRAIFA